MDPRDCVGDGAIASAFGRPRKRLRGEGGCARETVIRHKRWEHGDR